MRGPLESARCVPFEGSKSVAVVVSIETEGPPAETHPRQYWPRGKLDRGGRDPGMGILPIGPRERGSNGGCNTDCPTDGNATYRIRRFPKSPGGEFAVTAALSQSRNGRHASMLVSLKLPT